MLLRNLNGDPAAYDVAAHSFQVRCLFSDKGFYGIHFLQASERNFQGNFHFNLLSLASFEA
jgi:hypothetical protein